MSVLFPASVVGSLPRPQFVRDMVFGDGDDVPPSRLDDAIRSAVAMQEQAGLDVVTDGEWRRRSYIGVIAELAHGFTLERTADGRPFTVVTGELRPREAGFVAREVEFLRGVTKRRVKSTLPAPALLGERMWDPARSAGAYPTREAFVRACVPILRAELERIVDAGADIVQIDDPHLCLFVDPNVRASHADCSASLDFAVDTVNELVEDVRGVTLAVHLCRRAGGRARGEVDHGGDYGPILDWLNRLRVHHLTMEFTSPGAGEVSVLQRLRPDLEIGLGSVDVTPGRVDSVDTIVRRVRAALEHVAAERITLNPDCGFAPGSGAVVDLDEVYVKLCNEVAAARALRL